MENLNQEPRQQRNLEKDKVSFSEEVARFSIGEIPTAYDEAAATSLMKNLKDKRLFILGEMHGVKENVNVIYTLFKKFGFRRLALEWEPELKNVAEKFLRSGVLDFDAIKDSPDGRITAGHFALIKKLDSEGLLEEIICFNGGTDGESWNSRDASMARNVLVDISGGPTLVVAGNLHAETEPVTFDDEPEVHHPMGEVIKKEIPDVPAGKIEYLKGRYHNFGAKEFRNQTEGEGLSTARFHKDEEGLYMFELPEAHAAAVPNPDERISNFL